MRYTLHFCQCGEVLKALERCVLVPGDLHASLFHTLGPVYTLFYGSFIQPIQTALGFKHIDWQKVEKAYRQSSILVIMILTRVEVRLIEAFVREIPVETIVEKAGMDDNGNALATHLAVEFEAWIVMKIDVTTDDWFRFILNFFIHSRDYRTVRESIRNGDSLMVEALQQRFMYIWCAIKKSKCFENGLCAMETFYNKNPFWVLQVVRENRTGRLYDGREVESGRKTSDRALDECMEIVQHKYKSMEFPGTEESFERHSYNMPLSQKCATYAYHQYSFRYDLDSVEEYNSGKSVGDSDVSDKGSRKKVGVPSKRTEEKKLIDEILTLSNVTKETEGRSLDADLVWKVLPKITVDLKKTDEVVDKEQTQQEENMEENDISRIVPQLEEMRQLVRGGQSAGNSVGNEEVLIDEVIELSTDSATAEDVAVDENDNIIDPSSAGETSIGQTCEVIFQVGKTTRRVRKIGINSLAVVNVHELGRQRMIKMDLRRQRLRRHEREKRERQAFHQNLFDFLSGMENSSEIVFLKLTKGCTSNERRKRYEVANKLYNI